MMPMPGPSLANRMTVAKLSTASAPKRLKNKFGTQFLPTAELVLENMRGWLIGREGRGVHEISTILTLTRIHSAVAAVGGVGRGLAIERPSGWEPVAKWNAWKAHLEGTSQADLMGEAREVVMTLGDIIVALLLYVDAGSDGNVVAREILVRFLEDKGEIEGRKRARMEEELGRDLGIVFGSKEGIGVKL